MPGLHGVDLVMSTEHERPEDVATRIRDARPDWLGPPRGSGLGRGGGSPTVRHSDP